MRLFLLFLAIFIVLAFVLNADVLFTAVWFLACLYTLSRVWIRRAVGSVTVGRQFIDHAYTGDRVTVEVQIRNRGRLPVPWIEVTESMPMDLLETHTGAQVMSLRGRETRPLRYTLVCRRRGYYPIGPLNLESGDLLGLENRRLTFPEPRHLTVYPRIVPLSRLKLAAQSSLVTHPTRIPLFEDPTRVMGVREYHPGDSPRRIHWSASARLGRTVVKQYQPATARDTLLCLDCNIRGYVGDARFDAFEMAVVCAASLAHHIIMRESLPVGLAMEGTDGSTGEGRISLPPRSERAHLIAILERLARVRPESAIPFDRVLEEESMALPWGATILVITGSIEADLAGQLLHLKRAGKQVSALVVSPRNTPASLDALPGIEVRRVWTDLELAA